MGTYIRAVCRYMYMYVCRSTYSTVTVFSPARSPSSSAPTSSTFSLSAPASPTARCGSPPPRSTTPLWRPCSSASSQSESCISKAGQQAGGSRRYPGIWRYLPMRRKRRRRTTTTRIQSDKEQRGGKKSDHSVMQRRICIFMELCVWTHLENMKEDPQRHIVFDGENWNSFEKILSTVRLDTLLPSSVFCIKHATFFLLCQLKMLNLFSFSSFLFLSSKCSFEISKTPLFYSQGVVVCQKKKIKGIFYCSFYAWGVAEKNFVILHYTLNPLKLLKYKLQVWNNGDSSFYLVVQQKYSFRVNCVSDTTAMENWLVYHQPTYIWK